MQPDCRDAANKLQNIILNTHLLTPYKNYSFIQGIYLFADMPYQVLLNTGLYGQVPPSSPAHEPMT